MPPFTPVNSHSELPGTLKRLANPTVNEPPTLVIRQDSPPATVTVFSNEGGGGGGDINLTGGELAGIIIGCIAGTLLLLWLIRSLCMGGGLFARRPLAAPVARSPRSDHYYHHEKPRRHRSRHSRSRSHRSPSMSVGPPPAVMVRDYSRGRRDDREYYR